MSVEVVSLDEFDDELGVVRAAGCKVERAREVILPPMGGKSTRIGINMRAFDNFVVRSQFMEAPLVGVKYFRKMHNFLLQIQAGVRVEVVGEILNHEIVGKYRPGYHDTRAYHRDEGCRTAARAPIFSHLMLCELGIELKTDK